MTRRIRIAIDQTANIDERVKQQLAIETLPIHLTNLPEEIENALQRNDYVTFYHLLEKYHRKPHPGTKAGSVFEIKEVLEQMIIADDCDIICFVVGGNLSAIYDNTIHAAQELMRRYPNQIAVIGEQAFLSLEMLAQATADYVRSGKQLDEVLNFIDEKRHRVFVLGGINNITRLHRTGRVPIPKAITGTLYPFLRLFHLIPVFILESEKPKMMKVVRRGKLLSFVHNSIRARVGFKEPLSIKISYTGSEPPPEALLLKENLVAQKELVIVRPIELTMASPVIGVHTGASLVALGVLGLGYDFLSTEVLLKIFIEVQDELKNLRSTVNAINIFPVRDGDTGTNLLMPLIDVTAGISSGLPVSEALNQIVIRIARRGGGYSGGALSAFFLGFNTCVRQMEKGNALRLETLVYALGKGTQQCYEYFGEDAKEGTILSVMRACSRAAKDAFDETPTFRNVLISAYFAATDELLYPQIQEVEILRQQKLVDAGGFGFTLILWAILKTLGLHREQRVYERYKYVLREVRRHAQYTQRLIYRKQPLELCGYCVEGCVRGEVAEELRNAFLKLDNRLPNPKITFNVVDGTTFFHIHVSDGLEHQVLRIASRFGYVFPPRPPTRLAKRRREILQFRVINFLSSIKRVPRYLLTFFINWVFYALFFPIMWARQHHQFIKLNEKINELQLILKAFEFLVKNTDQQILVLDQELRVLYCSITDVQKRQVILEHIVPADVVRELRVRLEQIAVINQPVSKFECCGFKFDVIPITLAVHKGYLVRFVKE